MKYIVTGDFPVWNRNVWTIFDEIYNEIVKKRVDKTVKCLVFRPSTYLYDAAFKLILH
jgi:hypothetical protein